MTPYTYTLRDGSLVDCIDLSLRRASCPDLGLGPMPTVDLHEAIDLLGWALLALEPGDSYPENGFTVARTVEGAWRVTVPGALDVTTGRLADALCAVHNARRRAARRRRDAGFPLLSGFRWADAREWAPEVACGLIAFAIIHLPWLV